MTDTVRTVPALETLLADGQAPGSITPQIIRDMLVSLDPLGSSVAWGRITGAPTDIAGFGLTSDFNTKGDARWLSKTGGTLSGPLTVKSEALVHQTLAGSGTVNFDLSVANSFDLTVTGNVTFTVSNQAGAGLAQAFIVRITNGGSHTITYPATFKFPGTVKPTLTASGTDVLGFYTCDAGTTWQFAGAQLDDR